MNDNDKAVMEVNWILQESYKIAVKLRGINDWSIQFPFGAHEQKYQAERDVEQYQLMIAKMIQTSLINFRQSDNNDNSKM